MPRACSVCSHPKRSDIDRSLAAGVPLRELGKRYSLGAQAIHRHRLQHLTAAIIQAKARVEAERQVLEDGRALSTLDQVRACTRVALELLSEARVADPGERGGPLDNVRASVVALGEVRKQLELQAKLLGEVDTPARETAPAMNPREVLTYFDAHRAELIAAAEQWDREHGIVEVRNG